MEKPTKEFMMELTSLVFTGRSTFKASNPWSWGFSQDETASESESIAGIRSCNQFNVSFDSLSRQTEKRDIKTSNIIPVYKVRFKAKKTLI